MTHDSVAKPRLQIIDHLGIREATARHDRPDSGSASAGASRMESGELRRPAARSVRANRVPSLKNTLTFFREHPTGGEGQAQYHRFVVLGTNRSLSVY